MKTIEISTDSPAGRTVCALASALNLDPQDVLQGILFGICNRRSRESTLCATCSTTPAPSTTFPTAPCQRHNSTRCPG